MLDTIDEERCTVEAQKCTKIKAANVGSAKDVDALETAGQSGAHQRGLNDSLSRATRIIKIWVPGMKFSRNRTTQYENNTPPVKFYDYHLLAYADSNYGTLQDLWNV